MKSKVVNILTVFIYIIVISGTVFFLPYYKNSDGLHVTLLETNVELSARLLLIGIFVVLIPIIVYSLKYTFESLLFNQGVRYVLKIFLIVLAIGYIVWLMLFTWIIQVDYLDLGIDFVNANIDHYSSTLSTNDIRTIGESLEYGVGYYTTWIIALLMMIHSVWYYKHFNALYELEEI
jgi:hypothetical protein